MSFSSIPEVVAVPPVVTNREFVDLPPPPTPVPKSKPSPTLVGRLLGLGGWLQRWVVGAVFCMTYAGSVFVVGWAYRWMQAVVLKAWWKKSRFVEAGSFREFCRSQQDAPQSKPGFLWGLSLWRNFKTGVSGLFCTYLLTGWGCLLMYFGWIYGWQDSFFKVYEEYIQDGPSFGMIVSLFGMIMFIAAMYYVLMAQVHHAFTGERQAFFDFAFVWQLIKARPTAYLCLLMLVALFSLPVIAMKISVINPNMEGHDESLTNAEILQSFAGYVFGCCLFFFPLWLITRAVAARIYAGAVLKVLRTGQVSREKLHPRLAAWLERLDIMPIPKLATAGVAQMAKTGVSWTYRRFVYGAMFVLLLVWVFVTFHIAYFFVAQPVVGFMSQEMVQFPSLGMMPYHLVDGAWREMTG